MVTFFIRGVLAVFLVVAALKQASAQDARQNAAGQFDFYVLSLSWSPSFCAAAAERDGARYLIGIKTGNKYQVSDLINPTYNVRKGGVDVKKAVAQQYNATLAWVAIAVVPEEQRFGAYFGTIAQIEDAGERFSIPMRPE